VLSHNSYSCIAVKCRCWHVSHRLYLSQEDGEKASKSSSKGVRRAGRKMVSFMEQNPMSPTLAAEVLAGHLLEQVHSSRSKLSCNLHRTHDCAVQKLPAEDLQLFWKASLDAVAQELKRHMCLC